MDGAMDLAMTSNKSGRPASCLNWASSAGANVMWLDRPGPSDFTSNPTTLR